MLFWQAVMEAVVIPARFLLWAFAPASAPRTVGSPGGENEPAVATCFLMMLPDRRTTVIGHPPRNTDRNAQPSPRPSPRPNNSLPDQTSLRQIQEAPTG